MKTGFGLLSLCLAGLSLEAAITNPVVNLASPNGNLVLTLVVTNFDGSVNCPVYSITQAGRTLIANSRLALTFGSGLLRDNLTNVSQSITSSNSTWQPVWGERSTITNRYNQLVVSLQETASPDRRLQLTFRAYDEAVAFCYTIPAQSGLTTASGLTEQTEFRFPGNYPAWSATSAQGKYVSNTVSGIPSGCERPLPVQVDTNLYLAIGEARLVDYARMKFAPLSGKANSLVSVLGGSVTSPLPLTTPWRFVMVADSPGRLLENNYLMLNLNDPCALSDTSWIRPGKAIRSTSLTTSGGVACVDFAVKHRLAFIEFDAGWYGRETSTLSATNVAAGVSLDLPYVINYAATNGVGVILYVNWLALTNQVKILPALYEGWGIKGVKFGFVGVGPQQFTSIVNDAIRRFATNHIMVDIHDEFRDTGYARTYPNLMSVEGISGDEATPTAVQETTLLFSRMLAGSADHTVCYFTSRVTNKWSNAYQLAKPVCFFSAWQFLYWYDSPTNIPAVPELEFYDYLPTVWDETRVLQASIGQYAIIARRSSHDWFIGAMNATTRRSFTVPLNFLPAGQKYVANVYSQDPSIVTPTQVRIDRLVVDASSVLNMTLDASRGQAVRLTPAIPPAIR